MSEVENTPRTSSYRFEAEIDLTDEEVRDAESVAQAVQNRLGSLGTCVISAEEAA